MTEPRVSRRTIIKGTGAAAVGTVLGGALASTAGAAPRRAPAVIRQRSQGGKTITLAVQAFAHEAMKPVLAKWEEKTGNTVKLESGPVTGQEMVTQYAPQFQSETSPVDVFSDADDSSPTFMRAGWLEPLDEAIPQETWDDFPEIFASQIETWHSYEGKRYRVPHEFAIGYTFYRKDWFDAKGLQPPKTWDEVVSIGKEFTAPPVFGTLEAISKPGLAYVYTAYLCAQSGGNVFEFDEATGQALQFAYDLIHTHKIMPETALSINYEQQNVEYMNDHVAFMRQWPFFFDVARGNTAWYAEGKAEIALPPAGAAGAKSWWGGWGWSVPKFAPNKEEALDLIAFITSKENAPILAKGQSFFATPRKSIMEALGNTGIAPYMQLYVDNNVPSPRPFHPKIAEAQAIVDDVASLFLTKQASLSEALAQGKERIKALG
ncbi:MAG: ABC transporter substrate-binding protein [Thermomicrobiales bacterium]|nr:MAG: ABC transporter substrate-binding protein [Thermomicrobiales bacterium]